MAIADRVPVIIVEQLGVSEAAVTPAARLREDLGADELDVREVVMACEEEFGALVSGEDTTGFRTVADLVDYFGRNAGL